MKFVFTCGGTAGHVNPAISIAEKLKEKIPDAEFLFIGAEGQMELDLVPRCGFDIMPVKITSISRGHSLKDISNNLETVKNSAAAVLKAKSILKEFQPDAVIGTGGYVCFPVISAAHELHVPTFIHESNAIPGLTTKLLSPIVDFVFVGFEKSAQYYKAAKDVVFTGTPVRDEFGRYTRDEVRKELGIPDDVPVILSVWGSLGSEHMNEVMLELVPALKENTFRLIHSTGKMYYPRFQNLLNSDLPVVADGTVDIREYLYDIPKLMIACDLVLCRAGASTLSELAYLGKPAVIVPSPNVTNNHQEKNARVLEEAGAAIVLLENEFSSEKFLSMISAAVSDKDMLFKMGQEMKKLGKQDASEIISSYILSVIGS